MFLSELHLVCTKQARSDQRCRVARHTSSPLSPIYPRHCLSGLLEPLATSLRMLFLQKARRRILSIATMCDGPWTRVQFLAVSGLSSSLRSSLCLPGPSSRVHGTEKTVWEIFLSLIVSSCWGLGPRHSNASAHMASSSSSWPGEAAPGMSATTCSRAPCHCSSLVVREEATLHLFFFHIGILRTLSLSCAASPHFSTCAWRRTTPTTAESRPARQPHFSSWASTEGRAGPALRGLFPRPSMCSWDPVSRRLGGSESPVLSWYILWTAPGWQVCVLLCSSSHLRSAALMARPTSASASASRKVSVSVTAGAPKPRVLGAARTAAP